MKSIPFSEYLQIDALNWSKLKEMRRSALHFHHAEQATVEDNSRLAMGRAVHTAVLEPFRFVDTYAVFSGARRQGKAWEAFEAENAGKTILKVDEVQTAMNAAAAVRRHPLAGRLLHAGKAEQSITWTDPKTGIACKARPDWIDVDSRSLLDLKTTGDIAMRRFGTIAARFGYHCQIAWYVRGLRENGIEIEQARIVAVEYDAPFDVGVFAVDDDLLFAADEEVSQLLGRVKWCRDNKAWDGNYTSEVPLELPAWWYGEDEAELGIEIKGAA